MRPCGFLRTPAWGLDENLSSLVEGGQGPQECWRGPGTHFKHPLAILLTLLVLETEGLAKAARDSV